MKVVTVPPDQMNAEIKFGMHYLALWEKRKKEEEEMTLGYLWGHS